VADFHREGKYSGAFSLSDVKCLPGEPCQLSHFSDRAYRQQHQRLHQGGPIPVELYSAPEIHAQPEPSAASDHAVLGRLLLEVVLGSSYPDPTTRMHLGFLGNPQANEHLRPRVARLAPLAQAFCRLCDANAFAISTKQFRPGRTPTAGNSSTTVEISGASGERVEEGRGRNFSIAGTGNKITIRGQAGLVEVTGSGNIVTIEQCTAIDVSGIGNKVTYSKGQPSVDKSGLNNEIIHH